MHIELSDDEALVLFDFLGRWDATDRFTIVDPSERRVLWDLLASLERQMAQPFRQDYEVLLAAARGRVRDQES